MRAAFRGCLGVSPTDYRRGFSGDAEG